MLTSPSGRCTLLSPRLPVFSVADKDVLFLVIFTLIFGVCVSVALGGYTVINIIL